MVRARRRVSPGSREVETDAGEPGASPSLVRFASVLWRGGVVCPGQEGDWCFLDGRREGGGGGDGCELSRKHAITLQTRVRMATRHPPAGHPRDQRTGPMQSVAAWQDALNGTGAFRLPT